MKQTSVTTNAPCWTELGTSDPPAARAFYTELFGWQEDDTARPGEGDYTQMLVRGAPAAAITPRYAPQQPIAWTVCMAVADADATAARIKEAGGRILKDPTDAFDFGRFSVAADQSGAVFILWQGRSFKGAGVFDEPGALGWAELLTRDPSGSLAFYPAVFGWEVGPSEGYPHWRLDGRDFGGMLTMDDRFPPQVPPHWLPYFGVVDVDDTVSRAAALGGAVLAPASGVPGGRRIAVLRDPQGAAFGVYTAGAEG